MEHSNKITILSLIFENKEILFGRFSDKLTHEMKLRKWKDIALQLQSLGIYSKDWKYLRDTTWQNFRKRTIEKRDNRQQTGSGGGKKCRYDDVDELVLKIIGKDSPVLNGLGVPESSGTHEAQVHVPETPEPREIILNIPTEKTPTQPSHVPRKRYQSISLNETIEQPAYIDLKTQKMEIELKLMNEKLEIAKRERYKLDLEILKLERELNIQQPSNFTLPFYLQNVQNVIIDSSEVVLTSSEQNKENSEDILEIAVNSSLQ